MTLEGYLLCIEVAVAIFTYLWTQYETLTGHTICVSLKNRKVVLSCYPIFAIGLPIAILVRLFAGVPLFWFIVIPITILTFIGIAKMDETSILAARKFKDSKSIDSLAMAKKYYEEYRRRDEKYEYEHFCEQQKYQ